MSDDLITLQEAAELIGKNLRTIQRHIKAGKLTRHLRDEKSYVSRDEVEKKFGKISKGFEEKPKPQATPETQETKSPPERLNYEIKWVEEIQKHAETREELGIWKGRAEAYQAFSARLLGDGKMPEIQPETKKNDIAVPEVPISSSKNNSIMSPLLLYIIMAILFLALVFVIIIFVIIYRNRIGLF